MREGINLRGYAQLDPLVEYKNEAYSMFERLVGDINFEATRRVFKVEVAKRQAPELPKEQSKPRVYKSASGVDPFTQAQRQQEASPPHIHLPTTSNVADASNISPPPNLPTDNPQSVTGNQIGFRVNLPGQTKKKPGRNDPCWCGSGKKYKKCHYPN